MVVRKNINTLSPSEKAKYIQGVKLLKTNGTYNQFVSNHSGPVMPLAHWGPAFLPWHREYLRRFELALQQVLGDSDYAVPYWDWGQDALYDNQINTPLWANNFMGGNGSPVTLGPFSASQWEIFPSGNLNRNITNSSLPSVNQVFDTLSISQYDSSPWNIDSNENNSFRQSLEVIHGDVHVWVGGNMANMDSPNDPVFWLHHSNVDRIWAIWQCKNGITNYLPVNGGPSGENLNDPMIPWDSGSDIVRPSDVLNFESLGYTYDTLVKDKPGRILHTVRYPGGGWQPAFIDVEAAVTQNASFIHLDTAELNGEIHVVGITPDGKLLHTVRYNNGSWQYFFGDVEQWWTGEVGHFTSVSCAGVNNELHVIATTTSGKILHTRRLNNGNWQPYFGDVEQWWTGNAGSYVSVSCTGINNDLHVIAATTSGKILHTIRFSNGNWQPYFGDIEQWWTGEAGSFLSIACAGLNNELHVIAATTSGKILHTRRLANTNWQPNFGDIEQWWTGEAGNFKKVSCAASNGVLHVCGVNTSGKILHTIRYGNSWQPFFGDITGQTCFQGTFENISCINLNNNLHVICGT